TRKVRVAVRAIGATGSAANGTLSFTVPAGQKVVLATSVMSNLDSAMYKTLGVASLSALGAANVDTLAASHKAWWDSFYRKSFIEIQNKNLEKLFYGSLYLLACTSRSGEAAPGLWGSWILSDP